MILSDALTLLFYRSFKHSKWWRHKLCHT